MSQPTQGMVREPGVLGSALTRKKQEISACTEGSMITGCSRVGATDTAQ